MRGALLCALAALALLGWAAAANGTTAKRDVVLGATDQWIGLVLRVPIPERSDMPGDVGELAAGYAAVRCFEPTVARYDPEILQVLTERWHPLFEDEWGIVLHEHLHQLGGPCVYSEATPGVWDLEPQWRFWEEGIVDAVRLDLFPAFFRAMYGARLQWSLEPMDAYVQNVAAVRAASRYATGSVSWKTREARLWRRRALLASWDERQRMIAAAVAARG